MSEPKDPRCDACDRPIRVSQHEMALRDAENGQLLGRYHAPKCQGAAAKYFTEGVVLRASYYHPDRCGPDQERCDGGVFEVVA